MSKGGTVVNSTHNKRKERKRGSSNCVEGVEEMVFCRKEGKEKGRSKRKKGEAKE